MTAKKALAIAALAGVLIAAGYWHWTSAKSQGTEWQGWVEGDYLFVGADDPGRLTDLKVMEGDTVTDGALLFTVQSDIQEQDLKQARAQVDEARARLARLEAAQQRPEEIEVLEQQRKRAEAALEQSKPELDRAEALVKNGTSPASRLDQAKAAYNRDAASLGEIEKQIAVARMRSRIEDIEAARTVVTQAEAHLSAAQIRGQQRTVRSPATGLVQEVFYRPGEVVPAGRPVVSVLPPNNLKLRFFVPQSQLPLLHQGQMVNVNCDGCAKDLAAKITFISSQAEFTPPVIFSELERQKLVFRIEAHPEQPERFRVGQPVSVDMTHTGAG